MHACPTAPLCSEPCLAEPQAAAAAAGGALTLLKAALHCVSVLQSTGAAACWAAGHHCAPAPGLLAAAAAASSSVRLPRPVAFSCCAGAKGAHRLPCHRRSRGRQHRLGVPGGAAAGEPMDGAPALGRQPGGCNAVCPPPAVCTTRPAAAGQLPGAPAAGAGGGGPAPARARRRPLQPGRLLWRAADEGDRSGGAAAARRRPAAALPAGAGGGMHWPPMRFGAARPASRQAVGDAAHA